MPSDWQPAIAKTYDDMMGHILEDFAKRTGLAAPPQEVLSEVERRTQSIEGKRILVRPIDDPAFPCSCGAPTVEVEANTAAAALPDWGCYGQWRPTICSGMLYLD